MEEVDQVQVHGVAAIEGPHQLLGGDRLGGVDEGPQRRVDVVPPRMLHEGPHRAQLARTHDRDEVADGFGVEDRLEDRDFGAERLEDLDGALADGENLRVDRP